LIKHQPTIRISSTNQRDPRDEYATPLPASNPDRPLSTPAETNASRLSPTQSPPEEFRQLPQSLEHSLRSANLSRRAHPEMSKAADDTSQSAANNSQLVREFDEAIARAEQQKENEALDREVYAQQKADQEQTRLFHAQQKQERFDMLKAEREKASKSQSTPFQPQQTHHEIFQSTERNREEREIQHDLNIQEEREKVDQMREKWEQKRQDTENRKNKYASIMRCRRDALLERDAIQVGYFNALSDYKRAESSAERGVIRKILAQFQKDEAACNNDIRALDSARRDEDESLNERSHPDQRMKVNVPEPTTSLPDPPETVPPSEDEGAFESAIEDSGNDAEIDEFEIDQATGRRKKFISERYPARSRAGALANETPSGVPRIDDPARPQLPSSLSAFHHQLPSDPNRPRPEELRSKDSTGQGNSYKRSRTWRPGHASFGGVPYSIPAQFTTQPSSSGQVDPFVLVGSTPYGGEPVYTSQLKNTANGRDTPISPERPNREDDSREPSQNGSRPTSRVVSPVRPRTIPVKAKPAELVYEWETEPSPGDHSWPTPVPSVHNSPQRNPGGYVARQTPVGRAHPISPQRQTTSGQNPGQRTQRPTSSQGQGRRGASPNPNERQPDRSGQGDNSRAGSPPNDPPPPPPRDTKVKVISKETAREKKDRQRAAKEEYILNNLDSSEIDEAMARNNDSSSDGSSGPGKVFKIDRFDAGEEDDIHIFLAHVKILLKSRKITGQAEACAVLTERLGKQAKLALRILDPKDRTNFDKCEATLLKSFDDGGHTQASKRKFKNAKQQHDESYRQLLNRLISYRRGGYPERPSPSESMDTRRAIIHQFHNSINDAEVAVKLDYCFISQMKAENEDVFEDLLAACETFLNDVTKKNKHKKKEEPIKDNCPLCKRAGHGKEECKYNTGRTGIAAKPVKAIESDLDEFAITLNEEEVNALQAQLDGVIQSLCFACNEPGHFAVNCPNKARIKLERETAFKAQLLAAAQGQAGIPANQRAAFYNPPRAPPPAALATPQYPAAPQYNYQTPPLNAQMQYAALHPGTALVPPFGAPALYPAGYLQQPQYVAAPAPQLGYAPRQNWRPPPAGRGGFRPPVPQYARQAPGGNPGRPPRAQAPLMDPNLNRNIMMLMAQQFEILQQNLEAPAAQEEQQPLEALEAQANLYYQGEVQDPRAAPEAGIAAPALNS
jgi:hypothetical protein